MERSGHVVLSVIVSTDLKDPTSSAVSGLTSACKQQLFPVSAALQNNLHPSSTISSCSCRFCCQ